MEKFKSSPSIVIFLMICLFASISSSSPTNYYAIVDQENGVDSNHPFSKNLDAAPVWKTLSFAMDNLKSFASYNLDVNITLYLKEGNYSSSTKIDDALFNLIAFSTLNGSSNSNVFIDPLNQASFLECSNVSLGIDSLNFQNFENTILSLNNSFDSSIINSHFLKNQAISIFIEECSNISINNLYFQLNTNHSIKISRSNKNLTISDCNFQQNSLNMNGSILIEQNNSQINILQSSFSYNSGLNGGKKKKKIEKKFQIII